MGSFPETFNDRKRTDETNANKFYKCMRSDVFEKSTKFHTDNVFAWSHCRAFFRAFSVNSPRWRIRGKRLRSDHVTQNALAWGLKGRPFDSAPGKYFLARIFFPLLDIFFWNHPYPPPSPPPLQSEMVVPKQMTFHYPVLIGRDGWEIFLIGRDAWEICINQSDPLPRSGYRHVDSRGFLPLFLGLPSH